MNVGEFLLGFFSAFLIIILLLLITFILNKLGK